MTTSPTLATKPIKHLYRLIDERCGARSGLPLLSVSQTRGVVPRSDLTDKEHRADSLSLYKVCTAGDIVINRMSAYQGALGISPMPGLVSPEYLVLRPYGDSDARYLTYLIKSDWFVGEMSARVRGIGSLEQGNVRTPRINPDDLGSIPVTLPTLDAQRRIADFLDGATARIDRLIELRLSTPGMVKARAQSALSDLFTSNFWHETKLKHLLTRGICYGVLVPRFVDSGGVRLIRVNDLNNLEARADDLVQIDLALSAEYSRTVVKAGDLLVAVVGSCGASAVVPPGAQGANLARAVARLQVPDGCDVFTLWSWTQTLDFSRQVALATGSDTAQPTLNVSDLSNFTLSIPSSIAEWKRAGAACREIIGWRDQVLGMAALHLRLLTERRQALITAAVTGQLDAATARGVA
jgi:type I restriction enzyme, S subunit